VEGRPGQVANERHHVLPSFEAVGAAPATAVETGSGFVEWRSGVGDFVGEDPVEVLAHYLVIILVSVPRRCAKWDGDF